MANPFEELAGLDRLIHEPARLAILAALSACDSADFLFLQSLTNLTAGNLTSHLAKLEAAELVAVEKAFVGRKPRTNIRITEKGRAALEEHWDQLERLRKKSLDWDERA